MKITFRKLAKPKVLLFLDKKCEVLKMFFTKNYENTNIGVIIISVLISAIIMTGLVNTFFPNLFWIFCTLLGLPFIIIPAELFGLFSKLFFGIKRRNRCYGFVMFICILLCPAAASQGTFIVSDLIFSILCVICLCMWGRSFYAILDNKKRTGLLFTTLGITTVLLILIVALLGSEGFAGTIPVKETQIAEVKYGQNYTVKTLDYGLNQQDELQTKTVDISEFATRPPIISIGMKVHFGYDLDEVPLAGRIWYPEEAKECPVLFIVHGNHNYMTQSYLGYEYLGQYLAENGYVVVSVDENSCNGLFEENDARAVLLLENMKFLLEKNQENGSPLYHKIDDEQIALAGHSRGGESVCTAYLFNQFDYYSENGNVLFDYHFNIKSLIAIAPTVDMYQPAEHAVEIENVNYLLLMGANDQDVSSAMGEKQYQNVSFRSYGKDALEKTSGEPAKYFKAMVYVANANHGQFNTLWGKYDCPYPINSFLNVKGFMSEKSQQQILKIYTKSFLDATLRGNEEKKELFVSCQPQSKNLPQTIYQQTYQSSNFETLCNFDEDANLCTMTRENGMIHGRNFSEWKEVRRVFGNDKAGENYVLQLAFERLEDNGITFQIPNTDLQGKSIVFDIADCKEEKTDAANLKELDGTVTLTDAFGHKVSARIGDNNTIYESLPVQLRKLDTLFGNYEFKHQFQTVRISNEQLRKTAKRFDFCTVTQIEIVFNNHTDGKLQIDNVGFDD